MVAAVSSSSVTDIVDLGPSALGRGVILRPDQPIPASLTTAPTFEITQAVLDDAQRVADALHELWVRRAPVIIRLHVAPAALKQTTQATDPREPCMLSDRFLFHAQRLHFLVWNNNVDLRGDEPVWWWSRKAIALGASPAAVEQGDVTLPDGTVAYCDGGPLQPLDLPVSVIPYASIESGSLRTLRNEQNAAIALLAPDQMAAVQHRGGAARIIAPAGSGKTRVLTERFRHVLNDWSVDDNVVCAVAYNTRAADEMSDRTSDLHNAHIRTLNSLAFAIVNGSGGFLRSSLESRQRRMLNERDVRNILQQLVELPRRMNADPLAVWIEALSSVRLGLVPPQDVEDDSGDLDGFAEVYDRYRTHLTENGLMDFDEQIYRAIEILLQDPTARATAQRKCRMLLVDEFQDLTPAHLLLVRLLASPGLDVFAVGDDDQVIYGYAGADPQYLVQFPSWFPGAAEHALEVNYRCPPAVVNAASNLLTRNAPRLPKTIHARPQRQPDARDLRVEQLDGSTLAQRANELITDWLADGLDPARIAVLTRVNVTLLPVQVLLESSGIPHTTPVDASLLDRTGISTALAYLRIGMAPSVIRRADIRDTVHRPGRKIARNVVDMMTKRSVTSVRDLRKLASSLSGNDASRVATYANDLQKVADAVRGSDTAGVLDTIRSSIGLGDTMGVLDSSRHEVDRSTHADDLSALIAVAHLHPDPETFEPWLRDMLGRRGVNDGVQLSTVHRVKGREWQRVLVYDANRRLFPHTLATNVAEERRVFHVALTRCSERAVVLADAAEPSPFLGELDAPGEPAPVRTIVTERRAAKSTQTAAVPAEIGLAVAIPGGSEGTIVEVRADGALLSTGKARMNVPYGTPVRANGKLVTLGPPRDAFTEKLVLALKQWRTAAAADAKVPAFTVLHDAHIDAIAATDPSTLQQLAGCKGVGPAKLERWGDEILAALESAR